MEICLGIVQPSNDWSCQHIEAGHNSLYSKSGAATEVHAICSTERPVLREAKSWSQVVLTASQASVPEDLAHPEHLPESPAQKVITMYICSYLINNDHRRESVAIVGWSASLGIDTLNMKSSDSCVSKSASQEQSRNRNSTTRPALYIQVFLCR